LAAEKAKFVSRSDNSGTHTKELSLWQLAGIDPQGDWYLKAGSGMAETLRIADEKAAYTLTDRATYLAQRSKLNLVVLVAGDELLRNRYSVIQLNPEKYPHLNHEGAGQFVAFLLSADAQQTIAHFGQDRFGQPLFKLMGQEVADEQSTALQADLETAVIMLNYEGMARPMNKDPHLLVRADGTAIAGSPFGTAGNSKRVEMKLSAEEQRQLLDFIVKENDFFGFSSDAVQATIETEVQKGRSRPGSIEPNTTIIRVRADGKDRELRYVNLHSAVLLYPEIRQLAQLRAIERRLNLLVSTVRAGGPEAMQQGIRMGNDELAHQFPDVKPLSLDDVTMVLQKPDGTIEIHLNREGERLDASHRKTTWARIERPADGEPRVTVGSTEK
jgi:hypothetical protein